MRENVELGKRIEECRKKNNMTLEEVGNALGLHRSTILRYEKGFTAKIKLPILQKLAEVLQTTPSYLISGYDADADRQPEPISAGIELRSRILYEAVESEPPLPPYYARDIQLKFRETPELLQKDAPDHLDRYFMICASDNDMSPRIRDGDYIVIRKETEPENGKVALLAIEGKQTALRRIIRHRHGITLAAFSPDVEPVVYSNEEMESVPVTVIGEAIEVHGAL